MILKSLFISLLLINNQAAYSKTYINYSSGVYNRIDTAPLQLNDIPIFNDSTLTGLFQKLYLLKKGKGDNVTVLHLGDSHVQIGNFPAAIRNIFSDVWGSSGFGTIFPYQIAGFNNFYVQSKVTSGEWEASRYRFEDDKYKFGVMGYTAKTSSSKATLEINVGVNNADISEFNRVQLLYGDPSDNYSILVKGSAVQNIETKFISATPGLEIDRSSNMAYWKKQAYSFNQLQNKLELSVQRKKDLKSDFNLYGFILEDTTRKGIVYDICGVDGARFTHLCNNASLSLEQITSLNPDLIIFSYGSNESYTESFDSLEYQDMIIQYLHSLKTMIPNVAILLTSPPDTRYKNRYPRNTNAIQKILKTAAKQEGLAFLDLREQMGGDGSIWKWLSAKLAGPDKLHFTKEGYTLQANLLMKAFLQSYNKIFPEEDNVPDVDLGKYKSFYSPEVQKSNIKFSGTLNNK